MTGKTSRTPWTSRGLGEMHERRWNVTVMKPWTERECTVCTGIPKD